MVLAQRGVKKMLRHIQCQYLKFLNNGIFFWKKKYFFCLNQHRPHFNCKLPYTLEKSFSSVFLVFPISFKSIVEAVKIFTHLFNFHHFVTCSSSDILWQNNTQNMLLSCNGFIRKKNWKVHSKSLTFCGSKDNN